MEQMASGSACTQATAYLDVAASGRGDHDRIGTRLSRSSARKTAGLSYGLDRQHGQRGQDLNVRDAGPTLCRLMVDPMAAPCSAGRARILWSGLLIFVTVGSMLPFDRLVDCMDRWAGAHREEEVIAQIGDSQRFPSHMRWKRLMPPEEYRGIVRRASLVVSHAGMGTVITARELGKVLIVLPRTARKSEATTDHQLATAEWLKGKRGIYVATSEQHLVELLSSVSRVETFGDLQHDASQALVQRLRAFFISRAT